MKAARLASATALAISLAACSGHAMTATPAGSAPSARAHFLKPKDSLGGIGTASVMMMDAPPQIGATTIRHINLAVSRIDVLQGNNYVTIASYAQPVMIDVLAHQFDNGANAGSGYVNQITYDGLRLVVDTQQSNAQSDTQTFALSFVNAPTQSSVGAGSSTTTSFEATNLVDITYGAPVAIQSSSASIEVDFNALETLTSGGSNWLSARPTIYAVSQSEAGRIHGTVANASGTAIAGATVVATDASGAVRNTTSTDANGSYLLHTLPPGTYHLRVYNTYQTAAGQSIHASNANGWNSVDGGTVTVSPGQAVSAPTITTPVNG